MLHEVLHRTQLVPLHTLPARPPSLFDLWSMHQFHSGALAIKAKVSPGTVQAMLCNQAVERADAQKVLSALSLTLRKKWTLSSVYVALIEAEQP